MKNTVLIFFSVLLMAVTDTQAQPAKQVKQMADADSVRLAELFRDLHQHPELAFMEERTSGIVAGGFKALGYEVITGIGKTGVVGILKNGNGPVVMYRADMDCNAVKEITGLSYSSTKTMFNSEGIPGSPQFSTPDLLCIH
ncbi:hypothetical protein [Terrimonas sp.]|uniref:hypothetical protein n=1 Tax=Terrimonas sp. TaxID=1914338 RepID=UPI001981C402|nr:hypothetical protein [Terrimonas sp.]